MSVFMANQPFMFGEIRYRHGGHFGPLLDPHLDIVILYKGNLVVHVDDQKKDLNAGEVGFVFNEHFVDYELEGDCHYTWCETGELSIPENVVTGLKKLPFSVPIWKRIDELQMLGVNLSNGQEENLVNLRNTLGMAVFYEFFRHTNLHGVHSPLPQSVARAKKYIEQNYTQGCDLEKIAAASRLTSTYLVSLFKKYMNMSPTQYLWHVRTEAGTNLLYVTDLPVGEIAARSGFKNQFHFSRYIKKHYGYSPTELRNRQQQRQPSIVKGNPIDIAFSQDG